MFLVSITRTQTEFLTTNTLNDKLNIRHLKLAVLPDFIWEQMKKYKIERSVNFSLNEGP